MMIVYFLLPDLPLKHKVQSSGVTFLSIFHCKPFEKTSCKSEWVWWATKNNIGSHCISQDSTNFDLPLYNINHIKLIFYNPNQWERWRILVNQKESNRPKISTLTVIINQTYQDKSNPQFSVLKPIAAMDHFCSSPRLFRVLNSSMSSNKFLYRDG